MPLPSNINEVLKKEISSNFVRFGEMTLHANYSTIPYLEIIEIYVIEGSNNGTFTTRLEQFKTNNGWVHLAGGLTLGIKNEQIELFLIRDEYIKEFDLTQAEILRRLGNPDNNEKDIIYHNSYDASPDSELWIYFQHELKFWFEIDNKTLLEMQIGGLGNLIYDEEKPKSKFQIWFSNLFGPAPIKLISKHIPKPDKSIYKLIAGENYQVIQEFIDHDRQIHPIGETWIFERTDYLPYHSGLSLFVIQDGEQIQHRFQDIEEEQAELLRTFMDYVKLI